MLPLKYIFLQLLMALLLSMLLQLRFLEHQVAQEKQRRVPIRTRYLDISNRVRLVDEQLRQLAGRSDFVPAEANVTRSTKRARGPTMKTAQQLTKASELSIDVHQPCGGNYGNGLTLVVIVYNRAEDFARRRVIRSTYGSALKRNPKSAIYFIVAKHVSEAMQRRLQQEADEHNDVIQVDYAEQYYNCTVKGVALVRWAALHCLFAKFVFKFDDDSFLRLNPLLAELELLEPTGIFGLLSSLDEVIHQNDSKWFISKQYYPKVFYPPYIRGAYLIPGKDTVRLYEAMVAEPLTLTIPALPFDDVYITGILAAKAAIARAYAESFLLINDVNNNDTRLLVDYNVHFNYLSVEKLNRFWEIFGQN